MCTLFNLFQTCSNRSLLSCYELYFGYIRVFPKIRPTPQIIHVYCRIFLFLKINIQIFGVPPFSNNSPGHTVDGKNPAPVDRWFLPLLSLFIGFQPSFWWCRISPINSRLWLWDLWGFTPTASPGFGRLQDLLPVARVAVQSCVGRGVVALARRTWSDRPKIRWLHGI